MTTFESLGMSNLSSHEKLEVIGQLWDDLTNSTAIPNLLSESQKSDLLARQQDARDKPDDWVSWEDVQFATTQRLSQ